MKALDEILALVQQSEAESGTHGGRVEELEYLTTQILLQLAKLALRIDALTIQIGGADEEAGNETAKELVKLRKQVRKLRKSLAK